MCTLLLYLIADIWMVGDSLLCWAEERSVQRGKINLGLDCDNTRIRWFGVRGMQWNDLLHRMQYLMMFKKKPFMVIIHLGGNSVVNTKLRTFEKKITKDIEYMFSSYPDTCFVWSDILPRLDWRGVKPSDFKAMEKKRGCLNRVARKAVASNCMGRIIIHDNFDHTKGLFIKDGVHLSPVGNDLFLLNIQDGIQSFLSTNQVRYQANA